MNECFYISEDTDSFQSTEWTRGPWGATSQHAGPPAALLGRAVEKLHVGDMQVARVTFEILRPVPVDRLRVASEVLRGGKKVQLAQASLLHGDTEVMRASAWSLRTADLGVGPAPTIEPAPDRPADGHPAPTFPVDYHPNYIESMEWSFKNGSFLDPGPAAAWTRMRHCLVDDESPSPLTRVLVAVDSASGISSQLDYDKWIYINPDLSVYLHRLPRGEWVRLDAVTYFEPSGIGLARSTISDEGGSLGGSMQSLFISARS